MKYLYDIFNNLNNLNHLKNLKKYKIAIISILFIVVLIILILFILLIISYYIIKYLDINIVNDIYFCNYEYNKKSNELLKKYGDYKIKQIYLLKNPITEFNSLLLNLITFYHYEKSLCNVNEIFKKKCVPYHISLVIEINLSNNNKKFLLLEKSSYVNISENVYFNKNNVLKTIKLSNKNLTINSLLNTTLNRIGEKKFFNWSIYNNNCSIFVKELLITLGIYNKSNIKFISQKKFAKHIKFTNLTLHIINILCTLNNIVNNYLWS